MVRPHGVTHTTAPHPRADPRDQPGAVQPLRRAAHHHRGHRRRDEHQPGNLYYHFRNKDEIIGELYAALEARVSPLFATPPDRAPDVEDLWFLLHLLFEQMWAYRFFYRDLIELTSRNRRVALRFAELTQRGETTVIELCRGMVHAGAMRASEREIAAVARNVVIVATYWMSFQRTTHPPAASATEESGPSLERAAYQVLALIAPFAVGETRGLIERLGERYL
jgi:AcrR family transcriptional regulator